MCDRFALYGPKVSFLAVLLSGASRIATAGVSGADSARAVAVEISIGAHVFAPPAGTALTEFEPGHVSAAAVMVDGKIRWMLKSDEGTLPPEAMTMQVILTPEPRPSGQKQSPSLRAFSGLALTDLAPGTATFHVDSTHDANGQPFRVVCNLAGDEMQALTQGGTLQGMKQGYCRVYFSPAEGVRVLIQPFPVPLLPRARELLPGFYESVSSRLVAT